MAAGQRSYIEGFQDGRFYANGWHSTGEMGGVWAPPLKLVDGVWFGIGDEWVGQATKFSSGWGYTRFDLPDAGGLHLQRTDVAPDANRAALFGLQMTNPTSADKTVTVKVDAHSELMGAYPWGFSGVTPNASDNLADHGSLHRRGAAVHRRRRAAGRPRASLRGAGGLQPGPGVRRGGRDAAAASAARSPVNVCVGDDGTSMPSACDDGPFGKGTGGELRYEVTVPAGAAKTLWVAVAGSDKGLADAPEPAGRRAAGSRGRARGQGRRARQALEVVAGVAARRRAAAERDRLGQAEPRRHHADRLGPADPLDQPGQAVPAAARDGRPRPLVRRRLPRLPVDLRHRRRVHELRGGGARPVRHRQGPPAGPARHLRRPQRPLGHRRPRGRVRRLDLVRPRLADDRGRRYEDQRLQHRRDGQVPERGRAHLALDGRQPLPRRDVRLRQAQPAGRRSAPRRRSRRLARGVGQRRAHGHGPREARQRRLLHPLALRPRRHGALQARREHVRVGDEPRAQAPEAVRGHVVGHRRTAVRRLAGGSGQRPVLPEALDRPGADGGRAERRRRR